MTRTMARTTTTLFLLLILASFGFAQSAGPAENDLNARFSKALGTDASKIVQHYYLVQNGGVIELTAKDPADHACIVAIQKYLDLQKDLFERGKNDSDTEIHGKVPDGLAALKKLRGDITFFTVKDDNGAVLRMLTVSDQARQAIQDFMKFQINEHKTGDPLTAEE